VLRQNITINEHNYICDLYKADSDLNNEVQKEFVMLRKYDVMSDIIYDTDIYVIEKSVLKEVIADLTNRNVIVWPVHNSRGTGFSTHYEEFNPNYSEYTLCEGGSDIYKLYRQTIYDNGVKEYREAKILCDKIRVWHPHTKVDLPMVIYVDNYINDIHFHYYCNRYNALESLVETEFRIDNVIYSEYVEFYIPNIEDLISNKEVFFKEDLNMVDVNDSSFIDEYKNLVDNINITHEEIVAYECIVNSEDFDESMKSIRGIELPWYEVKDQQTPEDIKYNIRHLKPYMRCVLPSSTFVEKIKSSDVKYSDYKDYELQLPVPTVIYYEDIKDFNESELTWSPVTDKIILSSTKGTIYEDDDTSKNISIASYKELDETETENLTMSSLYLLTVPFKIEKDEKYGDAYKKVYLPETAKTIENNYLTYPVGLTLYPYDEIDDNGKYVLTEDYAANTDIFMEELKFTLSSKLGFNDDVISVVNTFNYPHPEKFSSFKEAYEFYNNVKFEDYEGIYDDDEDYEDGEVEQKQCIFELTIAVDTQFKQAVYTNKFFANDVDDFSFSLNGIFDSWDNLPELLICRVKFSDRYLGTVIYGNNVVVTKEQFKYCVNDLNHSRLHMLHTVQRNYNDENLQTIDDMNLKDVNFIDKINCIIKKEGESQTIYNVNNKPKIVYKPIFYRTQDLQNISLRNGMSQNIGINLADYMTKVDTFKLVINNQTIIETARNDVFTIFKIDTSTFSSNSGTYHILNEDDDYISSGKWEIND
jgi:hypothetical protein